MNELLGQILTQASYYGVAMAIAVVVIAFFQREFFMPFFRARLSFGRLVFVRIKAVNRDYYKTGRMEQTFLVIKEKEGERRIHVPSRGLLYRSLGCNCIDIDDETNKILVVEENKEVSGFDSIKYNNLYVRALTRPSINDNKEKIMIAAIILITFGIVAILFMLYKQGVILERMAGLLGSAGRAVIGG